MTTTSGNTAAIRQLIEVLRHDHIVFPRDEELRAELQALIEQLFVKKDPDAPVGIGNRDEQDLIVLVGATGSGKSKTIYEAFKHIRPDLVDPAGQPLKILSVKFPSPFSGKELARRILRLMDVKMSDKLSEVELWEAVAAHMEANRVGILHFDEMQRFATAKTVARSDRVTVADRLAATINEMLMGDRWPVSIVVSGTEEMLNFWRTKSVDQVHRRTKFVLFDEIDATYFASLDTIVKRYAKTAGLELAINTIDFPGRLALAGEYTLGITLELAQEAVVAAVREGSESLTTEHFGRIFARRTGAPRDENPFLSENWTAIDVRQKLVIGADKTTDAA